MQILYSPQTTDYHHFALTEGDEEDKDEEEDDENHLSVLHVEAFD